MLLWLLVGSEARTLGRRGPTSNPPPSTFRGEAKSASAESRKVTYRQANEPTIWNLPNDCPKCLDDLMMAARPKSAFFLTPPAKKTKTQGQNSSKKLKKKTQPLGGLSLPFAKLKKKTKFHETFSSKLKIFKGVALFTPFLLTNIFKNREK